jgi:tetratricopeptide (TPR) repeat protein
MRALEGAMWGFLWEKGEKLAETPLGRAQEIMHQAFGVADKRKRIDLARKALDISPDCADAYVLLAELAESRKEALELYRRGVEAGERALGPDSFTREEGHFWLVLETRPYMRARLGLAELLWSSGRRDEAIAHLQAMLKLNPNDNQGLRYILSSWLLNMDRFDELSRLLEAYNEASAAWTYTNALLAFRRDGDVTASRNRLKEALRINKHVPAYLLGTKPMPREQPAYYGHGDENEAILYAASAMGGWKATAGAMAWLKEAGPKPKARKTRGPRTQGPLPLVKKRLLRLPQVFDVWEADVRQLRSRVEIGGELVHPWIVIVTSPSNGFVLSQTLVEEYPSADLVWDQLAEAMQSPIMGTPHRPTELHVLPGDLWDDLKPHLDAIGVQVEPMETLDLIDFILEQLEGDLAGEQPPSLLDMPGVDREQVAGFYEAAAEFYRSAPWRKLGYESAIKVECDRLESGPRYAVVMGQSGLTFGLALYDDLTVLKNLWSSRLSDEENARETVALTVTFDDDSGISDADLDAIQQYEWEIAGPEAYPSIFRKERGMSMRPPFGWELELMQGCLRMIPAFVAQRPPDDLSKYEATFNVPSGELRLTLSWVET